METINLMGVTIRRSGTSPTPDAGLNAPDSSLNGYDCPICFNRGTITKVVDGVLWSRECECMAKRRTLRNIRNSGIADMCRRYTFASYLTPTEQSKRIKSKALEYVAESERDWFYICGRPGSGKTHICIAICNSLLEQGREVKYMLWREIAPKLKSLVNDDAGYKAIIEPLKKADVLYIDDFLKGKVTEADLNLAFELLNARYNDSSKQTIISTERRIEEVLDYDEAVGSRIRERAKRYCIASPAENWRLT